MWTGASEPSLARYRRTVSRWDARGTAIAIVATATLLLTSACVPDASPPETPVPTVDPAPLFSTEEEALAAAEAVYREYLATSDLIGQEGGAAPERLEPLVSPSYLDQEVEQYRDWAAEGLVLVGSTALVAFELQSAELPAVDGSSLVSYACVEYSGTGVVDPAGSVVGTPPSGRRMFEVRLAVDGAAYKLMEQDAWSGPSIC